MTQFIDTFGTEEEACAFSHGAHLARGTGEDFNVGELHELDDRWVVICYDAEDGGTHTATHLTSAKCRQIRAKVDARALTAIAALMHAVEWDAGTMANVAELVRSTGRVIGEP